MRALVLGCIVLVLSVVPAPRAAAQGDGGSSGQDPETQAQTTRNTVYVARLGESYSSALTSSSPVYDVDGSHIEVWVFDGQADQCVQVTMHSTDFWAYLML